MTEDDFTVVQSRLVQLFPRAGLNEAQQVAWLTELKGLPRKSVLAALDQVYSEKPNFVPAATDVRHKAEFLTAPDRKAEGEDPAEAIRRVWCRLRPDLSHIYAGWSDAMVFAMHSREVYLAAKLAFGGAECLKGYRNAFLKHAAWAGYEVTDDDLRA
jgi:hypothetical protein